jgi:hypothetical protein
MEKKIRNIRTCEALERSSAFSYVIFFCIIFLLLSILLLLKKKEEKGDDEDEEWYEKIYRIAVVVCKLSSDLSEQSCC